MGMRCTWIFSGVGTLNMSNFVYERLPAITAEDVLGSCVLAASDAWRSFTWPELPAVAGVSGFGTSRSLRTRLTAVGEGPAGSWKDSDTK